MTEVEGIKTQAFVVTQEKDDFKLTDVTMGPIRSDEVLVEMKYSGICHTDIAFQRGLVPVVKFPAIFGHEGAGVIKQLGSDIKDESLKVGDSVLLSFNKCASCTQCLNDHPALCDNHTGINHTARRPEDETTPAAMPDGKPVAAQFFGQSSFAKLSAVKEHCIVKYNHSDDMAIYAPLGCGFQTGAGTVLNVFKPKENQSVAVIGLGSVGMAAVMAASYMKVRNIIAIDLVPSKLDLAKEFGATHSINSKDTPDFAAEIKKITERGADFIVDCTGVVKVIESAINGIAPCGTVAVVGVPPAMAKLQLDPLMFLLENKKLIGVIEGDSNPEEFIPRLMDMHRSGNFPIDRLCKIYDSKDFHQALEDIEEGKVIKPILKWS